MAKQVALCFTESHTAAHVLQHHAARVIGAGAWGWKERSAPPHMVSTDLSLSRYCHAALVRAWNQLTIIYQVKMCTAFIIVCDA